MPRERRRRMASVKLDKPIPINPKRNIGRPPKPETIKRYYRNDPDKWLENVFGVQLGEKQREIIHDVWHNRYVAVKACYASSKSHTAACLAMAYSHLHLDSIVLTTASSFRQ